jgi:phage shock protein A
MPEDPTPSQPTPPQQQPADPQPATPVAEAATAAPSTEPAQAAGAAALPPVSPIVPDIGYTLAGVPTFDGVREKIETRYGTALGATELAEDTPEGRTAAQQFDARQRAAEEKLAEIRASMHQHD